MIENDKQLEITKRQAAKFKMAIDNFDVLERKKQGIDDRLIEAELAALVSVHDELREEIKTYEGLKNE